MLTGRLHLMHCTCETGIRVQYLFKQHIAVRIFWNIFFFQSENKSDNWTNKNKISFSQIRVAKSPYLQNIRIRWRSFSFCHWHPSVASVDRSQTRIGIWLKSPIDSGSDHCAQGKEAFGKLQVDRNSVWKKEIRESFRGAEAAPGLLLNKFPQAQTPFGASKLRQTSSKLVRRCSGLLQMQGPCVFHTVNGAADPIGTWISRDLRFVFWRTAVVMLQYTWIMALPCKAIA